MIMHADRQDELTCRKHCGYPHALNEEELERICWECLQNGGENYQEDIYE